MQAAKRESIDIDKTNTYQLRFFSSMEIVWARMTYLRDKLAVRIWLRNLNLKSQFSIFTSFRGTLINPTCAAPEA